VKNAPSSPTRFDQIGFQALAEVMPGLVFVTDDGGANVYTNPKFHEFSGRDAAALSGDGWLSVVDPGDRARIGGAWQHSAERGQPFETEFRMRRADGTHRMFLVRASPVTAADGRLVQWVGTGMDIEDTVAAREALAASRAELEAANAKLERRVKERTDELSRTNKTLRSEIKSRETMQAALHQSQKLEALGQLTSGIAHDFNNILAAIAGGFALIEKRAPDDYMRNIAEHCQAAAHRGAKLVKQMLAFARQEVLAPRNVDVVALIRDAEVLIRQAIPGTVVTVDVADDLPHVLIDPVLLETALLNLSVNARDAMPGGGTLSITAQLAPLDDARRPAELGGHDAVAISICDTGSGMPPEILQRVVEPFFTTKPPGMGTGLGLAMVHGFVTQSGGAMRIESEVGTGTTVTLFLRCGESDSEVDVSETPASHGPSTGEGTVLLVDDDADVRAITSLQLRDFGYTVVEAQDLASAIAAFDRVPNIDFVLTDVVMPGGDGVALAQDIRARRRDVPILFMTGRADSERVAGEMVIQKPFTPVALATLLTRIIETEARERATRARIATRLQSDCLADMLALWEGTKVAGRIPDFAGFDPDQCREPHRLAVLEVDAAFVPMRFRFVSAGSALEQALGMPLAGTELDVQGRDGAGSIEESYRRCVKTGQPVYDYTRMKLGDGVTERFERLVLPYSSGGRMVDRLVSVVVISAIEDSKKGAGK
jgi:PAS domain S-box-containing protein